MGFDSVTKTPDGSDFKSLLISTVAAGLTLATQAISGLPPSWYTPLIMGGLAVLTNYLQRRVIS